MPTHPVREPLFRETESHLRMVKLMTVEVVRKEVEGGFELGSF